MAYDSSADTLRHAARVNDLLLAPVAELMLRAAAHDASKLDEPEKAMYDEFIPQLQGLTYGTLEYRECLAAMGPALKHHYEANRHHPEHFGAGISGMTLIDLIEMLADWKAATGRASNGDLAQSLEVNQRRFHISPQLAQILENTARHFGWLDG